MKAKSVLNHSHRGGRRIVLTAAVCLAVLMLASCIFVTPAKAGPITPAVSAGGWHSLAWEYNDDGELGDGTTTWRYTPVQVSGLKMHTYIDLFGFPLTYFEFIVMIGLLVILAAIVAVYLLLSRRRRPQQGDEIRQFPAM